MKSFCKKHYYLLSNLGTFFFVYIFAALLYPLRDTFFINFLVEHCEYSKDHYCVAKAASSVFGTVGRFGVFIMLFHIFLTRSINWAAKIFFILIVVPLYIVLDNLFYFILFFGSLPK